MTTSLGPANGSARMRFEYTVSHSASTTTIYVAAYIDLFNSYSSDGYWPAPWSGQWGSGSNAIHRVIGVNGSSLVAGAANYYVARGSSNFNVTFRAEAGSYAGSPSHSITVTIPKKQTVPPAPTFLDLTSITNSRITARFSGNGDGGSAITGWDLQYSKASNFSSPTTIASNGTSTITGLAASTTYYFRARGKNAIGAGAWSGSKSAKTHNVPGAFTSTVASAEIAHNSATVRYSAVATNGSALTNFELQLSKSSSFASIIQTVTGAASSLSHMGWSGLTRLTTYYTRARVKNVYGWSPYSTVSFKTIGQVPSAPSDYTMSDVASTTAYSTLPTVADNGGLSLTSWQYRLNTVASDTGAITSAVSAEYIGPFLQGLTPGTTYFFKMLVRNSLGAGPYGPWISFTMRTDVPTPPTSVAVTDVTETTATASWAAPLDLLGSELWGYTLRFAQNTSFSVGLLEYTHDAEDFSQALSGLLPGTNYHVQVNAISANGPGSRSPVVSFKTLGTSPASKAAWLRIDGSWKGGTMWMRVAGNWKQVTLWQRISGSWRKN